MNTLPITLRTLLGVLFVLMLGSTQIGCATGAAFQAAQLSPLTAGQARVVLLRGHSLQGAGTFPLVRVNGQEVGHLVIGSYAIVTVPAGAVEVRFDEGNAIWSASYGASAYSFHIADQGSLYLRLQMATGVDTTAGRSTLAKGFHFGPIEEKTAREILPGLRAL